MASKWPLRLIRKNLGGLFNRYPVKYLHTHHHESLSNDTKLETVREYCHEFIAPLENETVFRNLMKYFIHQLNLSCFSENKNLSTFITKNTFMQDFSTGEENGQYLSLLIGEYGMEIMMVKIKNYLVRKSDKKTLFLTNFQRQNYTTDMLVALVAEFVIDYVRDDIPYTELDEGIPPLVITYTLPHWIDQISLDKGWIVRSLKGATLQDNEKVELQELLSSMLKCWGFEFKIKCLMSFGSACFHDKQWSLQSCISSIILDHGVTICHIEQTKSIKGFDGDQVDKSKPTILLMTDLAEFGANNELKSITTPYDETLDQVSSSAPGKRIFRKFVSETYVGELFRLMALKLINDGILLHSGATTQILKPFCLFSKDVAYFEYWMNHEKKCEEILKFKLGYDNYSMIDMVILSYLADVIVDRSARLIAMVVAALAERSTDKEIGFVFLGDFVSQHRILRHRLSEYIRIYTRHINKKIRVIKASSDSALRGAALFASRL